MRKIANSLDNYDILPEDMIQYLRHYGKHFSKKMYEWAVNQMYDKNHNKINIISKLDLENKLKNNSIILDNNILYDAAYVYCMCIADFMNSSIQDEYHVLLYVKDLIDDMDAVDGQIFNRFYADKCLQGEPIDWLEMI